MEIESFIGGTVDVIKYFTNFDCWYVHGMDMPEDIKKLVGQHYSLKEIGT